MGEREPVREMRRGFVNHALDWRLTKVGRERFYGNRIIN